MADGSINKKDVADSFSRAACSYDGAAELQRQVANELLAFIKSSDQRDEIASILDLGCGTGFMTQAMYEQGLAQQLYAADIAEGMISYGKSHHPANAQWLCADAEDLPLANDLLQWVYSSFALQWCPNLTQAFSEIFRVLETDGYFACAIPGPGTLGELEASWQQVDQFVHVNQFPSEKEIVASLEAVGFQDIEVKRKTFILGFPSVKALMMELKSIGAHNLNGDRSKGMTGKSKLKKLFGAYEHFRGDNGKLPATYEVISWVARKPA